MFSLGTGEIAPKSQNHLRRKGKLSWIEPTIEIGMMGLDKANFEKVKKLTTCSRLQPILLDELEDFTRPSNVPALILLTEGYLRGKGREEYQSMLSNLPGGKKYMSRLIEEIRRQVSLNLSSLSIYWTL